ncbi:diguanylate cyclase response regulator [filamentous cyanobacterium CCP3]|nr:diguanylate cyclase response regulator [filamentous cyanobacterium CCP3]
MIQSQSPALILVADDEPFIRSMLTRYLVKEQYQVIEAADGEQALDLYERHHPDLVLLDALMPVMDGFEVCQRLETLTNHTHAPILMITGLGDEQSVDHAFEIGVIDYITKPIHWAVLRQRVRRLIMQTRLEQQLREANRQLQQMTMIDSLTQVANRRRFDEYLLQEWGRGARDRTSLSLIICDIDCFKPYNDHYGHQAGDYCLQRIAATLSQCVNRPADLVSRYGGEEFAVVLPATTQAGAAAVASGMVRTVYDLALPHKGSDIADVVTISCGVASLVPTPDYLPFDLVFTADQALYEAKASGRNQAQTNLVIPASLGKPTSVMV